MTWTKPVLMRAVLNLNYTVLFSDLDTVWLKPAVWSMTSVLDTYNADVTAMPGNNVLGRGTSANLFFIHWPCIIMSLFPSAVRMTEVHERGT